MKNWSQNRDWNGSRGSDAVYGLGIIGAAVYYLQNASSLWDGVLGILKAILWPAFLIYQVLTSLKM